MIVSVPARLPAAVGVKITEIKQLAPAATLVAQVFVSAKSPEAAIDVIARAEVPELVSIIVCGALAVPSVCEANVRLFGKSVTAGAVVTGAVTVTEFVPEVPSYVESLEESGVYLAVNVSLPAVSEPLGTSIIALPLFSVVAAEV
jgi:hypothetical protein